MQDDSDSILIHRSLDGETEAYGELVIRYQQSVFNVCYRLLSNYRDAEDMTQNTFIRAYKRLQTFDDQRPFGPWIRKIATNLCINVFQKNTPASVPYEGRYHNIPSNNGSTPEDIYRQTEQADTIHHAILSLPPKHRVIIELRHYQELSYQEIAEILHIPLSDVKSYLFRGRKLLAERLKEYA
ncbi:MAG: sigma-70 family RNA polymerase sigma factor [Anaerolineales bacterium]